MYDVTSPLTVQTHPDLCSSCTPEDSGKVDFLHKSELSTHVSYVCILYKMQSSSNPYSDALQPDRSQRDRPASCVISGQYFAANHVSLSFPSCGRISRTSFFLFPGIKLDNSETV
jgi:hypothetical protein